MPILKFAAKHEWLARVTKTNTVSRILDDFNKGLNKQVIIVS